MKVLRLFDNVNDALGEVKTPVVFYLKGAPKPMFASKSKWGETCTIVVDDTEGSVGIKPAGITIIFKDNEGNIISKKEYKSGDTIIIPEAPVKSGLTFLGWGDVTIDKAVSSMTYIAQYEVTPKVTLDMLDSYTDTSSIALNATKTATVTGAIEFSVSLPSDVYHTVDNVIVFDKHYAGKMTVTASAVDVHCETKSDSKTISVSCDGADTTECVISDVVAVDVDYTATSAKVTYKCNVTTTTHAGVSNTVTSNHEKTVEFEANESEEEVTRTGSFTCEHGETVNWSVKQAGKPSGSTGSFTAVDLGLASGTKWASCNLGATKPEEYGDFYQWAGTTPVTTADDLSWSNCPYHTGSSDDRGFTKYVPTGKDSYGTVDDKLVLDPEDDAAHVVMGGDWHMPTLAQINELIAVSNEWTTENGVYGRKFTASNGSVLFIPAAGFQRGTSVISRGSDIGLWSASLYGSFPRCAYNLYYDPDEDIVDWGKSDRCYGNSVRGVLG